MKVLIKTFKDGANQGEVIDVGYYETPVSTRRQSPVTTFNGCLSAELVWKQVSTVRIGTHTIIVENGTPTSIKIPSGLAARFHPVEPELPELEYRGGGL